MLKWVDATRASPGSRGEKELKSMKDFSLEDMHVSVIAKVSLITKLNLLLANLCSD